MNYVKNPIVLGLISFLFTYCLINRNMNSSVNDNQKKNNNKNLLVIVVLSILVGILVWSITSKIFGTSVPDSVLDNAENLSESIFISGGNNNYLSNEKMILDFPDF